jgi:hypothetical protein
MEYDPAQLHDVDEIHVLVIGNDFDTADFSAISEILDVGRRFAIHATTSVTDPEAVKIVVQTWRGLPAGEQDRCHIPPYGLRFLSSGVVLVEASICWQCNNVFIRLPDELTGYSFDSQSQAGQRLLRVLQYLSGDYLNEPPHKILSLRDVL